MCFAVVVSSELLLLVVVIVVVVVVALSVIFTSQHLACHMLLSRNTS